MLRVLRANAPALDVLVPETGTKVGDDVVWIDLYQPTREEELVVEQWVGLELPTREEMVEIEPSSRLYMDRGASFMTAVVLCASSETSLATDPVTFVLAGHRLVTIRYAKPKAFDLFEGDLKRQEDICPNGVTTFMGLLEALVDRLADVLEGVSKQTEEIADAIFSEGEERKFRPLLQRLARAQKAESRSRESLVSLGRLIGFAGLADQIKDDKGAKAHLDSLLHDVQALADHATHLSDEMTFLLDAATGLINVEQNDVMKVFSVAAVVLMPPTLVAGVYGMNFKHMPELDWVYGYPTALGLMVILTVVPIVWFKRKGWL